MEELVPVFNEVSKPMCVLCDVRDEFCVRCNRSRNVSACVKVEDDLAVNGDGRPNGIEKHGRLGADSRHWRQEGDLNGRLFLGCLTLRHEDSNAVESSSSFENWFGNVGFRE